MTDEIPPTLYECQRDLAVARAVADDLRQRLTGIQGVLRLAGFNDDLDSVLDTIRRLTEDPRRTEVTRLLRAVEAAWIPFGQPEGSTPDQLLWDAVRDYMAN